MMKNQWKLLLLCLGSFALQANAQQPAANAAPTAADPVAEANALNKEQALKGGNISPRQRAMLERANKAETNTLSGASFLAENKAKPGVTTLPGGVQYKVIKAGSGKKPTEAGSVRVRYEGKLTDGTSFDKVDDKNPPLLQVAGFVPGLKEALKRMPEGAKWEVVIPPKLGYGEQGFNNVGPNAVLVYVIELVALK
jgi:FKBP-type peptidyl-prolyl cis-trans isomerase